MKNGANNRRFPDFSALFFVFSPLLRSFEVIFPKIHSMAKPVMRLLTFFNVLRINKEAVTNGSVTAMKTDYKIWPDIVHVCQATTASSSLYGSVYSPFASRMP